MIRIMRRRICWAVLCCILFSLFHSGCLCHYYCSTLLDKPLVECGEGKTRLSFSFKMQSYRDAYFYRKFTSWYGGHDWDPLYLLLSGTIFLPHCLLETSKHGTCKWDYDFESMPGDEVVVVPIPYEWPLTEKTELSSSERARFVCKNGVVHRWRLLKQEPWMMTFRLVIDIYENKGDLSRSYEFGLDLTNGFLIKVNDEKYFFVRRIVGDEISSYFGVPLPECLSFAKIKQHVDYDDVLLLQLNVSDGSFNVLSKLHGGKFVMSDL